jgi:dihydroflavonol-4-reductase
MRVFVTGGSGFIGSVVVRTLVAEGHEPRCLVRPRSRTHRIDAIRCERIEGDVRDAGSVKKGMDGCEGVIHLASPSAWNEIDSPLMDEVIEGGTRNVLDAARGQRGTRVVFVSSVVAVNGSDVPRTFDETATFTLPDAKLRYSRCKRAAERLCAAAIKDGVPVVIVNPGEVYGPGDTGMVTAGNLVDVARARPVLVCRGGTSLVYVDDVALGIVRALERGRAGERYILGGDNLTIRQLAELCLQLLARKKLVITVPNAIVKPLTAVATTLRIPLPYNPHVVPYATKYWFMDSSKAQRELGVRFRGAAETLGRTVQWLQQSGRIA